MRLLSFDLSVNQGECYAIKSCQFTLTIKYLFSSNSKKQRNKYLCLFIMYSVLKSSVNQSSFRGKKNQLNIIQRCFSVSSLLLKHVSACVTLIVNHIACSYTFILISGEIATCS